MKLSRFLFGLSLVVSILLVVFCYNYAYSFRECNAIGSEIFLVLIPTFLLCKYVDTIEKAKERKIERMEEYTKQLEKKYFMNI